MKANFLASVVAWVIVIFNKFVLAKVCHMITDTEKLSSFTELNISFAFKGSICLFLNTAIISFVIDIVMFDIILGEGGFIGNESQVFILNALFPPVAYFIDPWTIWTNYRRNKELSNIS